MTNPIQLTLELLKAGVKTKQKSYLLRGWRKWLNFSVIILFHGSTWSLIIYGFYKLFN
jgi:hypothetical protein